MNHDEIARSIGVDSLGYLSVEDVKKIALNNNLNFCVGCFTGEYPVEPPACVEHDKYSTPISQSAKKPKEERN